MMKMKKAKSKEIFEEAKKYIPGGVNSPVRAFKAVGGDPVFFKSAKGAILKDEDGNEYIDTINSWGPMILGHANPAIEEAVKFAAASSLSLKIHRKGSSVFWNTSAILKDRAEPIRPCRCMLF